MVRHYQKQTSGKRDSMANTDHQQVFEQWLRDHKGLMLKVVRAFAFIEADQDDLLQEVATAVWKSVPGFKVQSKVSTWIYRVALFTATTWSRKEKRRRLNLEESTSSPVAPAHPDADTSWLYEQIAQFPEADRAIVLLLLEGYGNKEIASTLGISANNVGVKLHRIKQRLITLAKENIDDL